MASNPSLEPLVEQTRGLQPWRRLFHAGSGLIIAGVLVVVDPDWTVAVGVLALLTAGVLVGDLVRLRVPALNHLFFRVFRRLASPREAEGLASSTWYMLGALASVAIFPREIAVSAILVLALADPAASYAGRRWGRRRLGAGTVEGSLVFLSVAMIVLIPAVAWPAGVATALVVSLAEAIPSPIDDNLVIPLATGALLWTMSPLF